ncbi:hypothetical protein FAZ69_13530 [Trinickia terrae]|uniref:Uncharacterized protein n=1 Tax=Trinickia terrae TaxID=2571161 RepID=A0A4U1I6D8_9BURK|nr:hypothetical protein [Trinickia terrae]TKC88765.1 hypothetical protein FAZ69_13530 [Trinickia terrae]
MTEDHGSRAWPQKRQIAEYFRASLLSSVWNGSNLFVLFVDDHYVIAFYELLNGELVHTLRHMQDELMKSEATPADQLNFLR